MSDILRLRGRDKEWQTRLPVLSEKEKGNGTGRLEDTGPEWSVEGVDSGYCIEECTEQAEQTECRVWTQSWRLVRLLVSVLALWMWPWAVLSLPRAFLWRWSCRCGPVSGQYFTGGVADAGHACGFTLTQKSGGLCPFHWFSRGEEDNFVCHLGIGFPITDFHDR